VPATLMRQSPFLQRLGGGWAQVCVPAAVNKYKGAVVEGGLSGPTDTSPPRRLFEGRKQAGGAAAAAGAAGVKGPTAFRRECYLGPKGHPSITHPRESRGDDPTSPATDTKHQARAHAASSTARPPQEMRWCCAGTEGPQRNRPPFELGGGESLGTSGPRTDCYMTRTPADQNYKRVSTAERRDCCQGAANKWSMPSVDWEDTRESTDTLAVRAYAGVQR
jgi:hypothetical protein